MESVNESAKQVTAAASAGEGAAPVAAAKPGKAKVAVSFIGSDKDSDLAAAITRILVAMTGNAAYPSPVPTLAMLSDANDAFVAAVHANDGGATAVVRRDQEREAVEQVLRELAAYVQHACQGDRLRLLESGFPAQRVRGPAEVQPLRPPVGLKVSAGKASGQVRVRCGRVATSRLYQWRYATAAAPTAWTLVDTSSSTADTLDGLTAGTVYTLQVRAFGKRGASDWSEAVTWMVT